MFLVKCSMSPFSTDTKCIGLTQDALGTSSGEGGGREGFPAMSTCNSAAEMGRVESPYLTLVDDTTWGKWTMSSANVGSGLRGVGEEEGLLCLPTEINAANS